MNTRILVPAQPTRAGPLKSAAIIVALAILGWLLLRPSPAPDSYWALIWGRDVLNGHPPQVDVPGAPSAHPLAVGVGAVLGVFGRAEAVDLFNGLALLSLGATIVGVFRLGQITFGTPTAWVASAAAFCSTTLVGVTMFSSLDATAFALTIWAAVLVASRVLRGTAPLVLLGLAGLQRPEVWILSAAYWIYLAVSLRDHRRAALLTMFAAAPVAFWLGFDVIVTHRFGGSLSQIQATAATTTNGQGSQLLEELRSAVPPAFRRPLVPIALAGAGLAVRMRLTAAILPAIIGSLGLVAAGVYVLADIILVGRFFVITALMCALFVGYAVMGGMGRPGRTGRAWRIGGALAGLVVLVLGVQQVNGVRVVGGTLGADARASAQEFSRLAGEPRVARILSRCAPIWIQTDNPAIQYLGSMDPKKYRTALTVPAIENAKGEVPDRGALVGGLPILGPKQAASSYHLVVPAGFSRVGSSGRWTLYKRGC